MGIGLITLAGFGIARAFHRSNPGAPMARLAPHGLSLPF